MRCDHFSLCVAEMCSPEFGCCRDVLTSVWVLQRCAHLSLGVAELLVACSDLSDLSAAGLADDRRTQMSSILSTDMPHVLSFGCDV